jgi:hypothetical protein
MPITRLTLIQLILFVSTMIALPHVLLIPFSKTEKISFDTRPSKFVHKKLPEVILIGNSMLKTRIKSKDFGQSYGKRSLAMPMGGSGSTRWYLLLKNSIIPASDRTKQVIIFFRDHEIIDPLFRTSNQHRFSVERMKIGKEETLTNIQKNSQNWHEAAWDWLYKNSWVIRIHRNLRSSFTVAAIRDFFPQPAKAHLRFLTKDRFEIENLRGDLDFEPEVLGRPPVGEPRKAIENSLLPEILRMTQEKGIKLLLYRVARRPGVEDVPTDYVAALKAYSKEHDITYIEEKEFFGDIPLEWYADGDHIRPTFKKEYSKKLGQKLKGRLE